MFLPSPFKICVIQEASFPVLSMSFREGTQKETIVVYVLYFTRSDTTTLVSVAKSVLRMESDRQIVINGTMYQITKASGIFLTFGGTSSGNDGKKSTLKESTVDVIFFQQYGELDVTFSYSLDATISLLLATRKCLADTLE